MKIKELFEVSDEKIREKDEEKIKWLYDRANNEVNVHITKDNKMWLTIDSVPILEDNSLCKILQTLTKDQKAQVRTNIRVASLSDIESLEFKIKN